MKNNKLVISTTLKLINCQHANMKTNENGTRTHMTKKKSTFRY